MGILRSINTFSARLWAVVTLGFAYLALASWGIPSALVFTIAAVYCYAMLGRGHAHRSLRGLLGFSGYFVLVFIAIALGV